MGQTLTHGIYLPDEGERNCYNGLAANWQLLDGAVGTIAAHTAALAGKAPLVHTHTKSQITDFPAYGATAGTICEGNDSRLSDARTPVAHTHTKSDITDLLNSNFIPSANNSYDLGSSSYQWNNLYAKNYFYNGTAWGLDKANVWSAWQTQEHETEPLIRLRRSNLQIGDPIPASQQIIGTIPFADKNNLNIGLIACRDNTNGDTFLTLIARQQYDSNGRANNGTQYESRIDLGIDSSKNLYLRPNSNGQINLGTSTNKWKTLNGINPGALSLPDYDSTAKLNLTSTFPTPDYNGNIYYTPTMNGWLYICFNISSATTIVASDSIFYIQAKDNNVANANFVQTSWMLKSGGTNSLAIFFPVVANKQFVIQINFTGYTLTKVFLIPGLGHVA